METVKQVLIRRDGNTESEAQDRIDCFVAELNDLLGCESDNAMLCLLDAESLVADHFGLEPDYLMEFI